MKEKISESKKKLNSDLKQVKKIKDLNELRVKYLGKKGIVTLMRDQIVNVKEKKESGILFNHFKKYATDLIEEKRILLQEKELEKQLVEEAIDISLPSTLVKAGYKHPLTKIIEEIEELFMSMGYDVISGPEIEYDLYNFERLNLPKNHPARDMHDSFYITEEVLLRTHTSPTQARFMEANKEKTPIRIFCPGKVYRKDEDDATHSHQFMQFEGLVVDKEISVAHLKGTLEILVEKLFGQNREIRFRPSYFPFTEPSFEVDVSCFKCNGKGCSLCKESGWIEILGAGMVHPAVLEMGGYDSKIYSGFAFGPGPERIAMLKYGITDIRQFYNNHLDFLETFNRIEKENQNEIK